MVCQWVSVQAQSMLSGHAEGKLRGVVPSRIMWEYQGKPNSIGSAQPRVHWSLPSVAAMACSCLSFHPRVPRGNKQTEANRSSMIFGAARRWNLPEIKQVDEFLVDVPLEVSHLLDAELETLPNDMLPVRHLPLEHELPDPPPGYRPKPQLLELLVHQRLQHRS